MKIIDILKKKEKGVSFEFFPPKTSKGSKKLKEALVGLESFKPLYISMTYGAGGSSKKRTKNTVSSILKNHKEFEVMPHLTCIGAEAADIEAMLNRYKAWGIDNIMALRGDFPQNSKENDFCFFKNFSSAYDLVKFIKKYNHFCLSAAVYPEGHIECKNIEEDLNYTKTKIDAGVDFAVTQMFFDNKYYYDFMEKIRAKNINIPILPGILPLTKLDNVERFSADCGVTVPLPVKKRLEKFKNNPQDMLKAGLEITINQCRDLMDNGAKQIHIFTLNKLNVTRAILEALDI